MTLGDGEAKKGGAAVHDQVYAALREAVITGRIPPGKGVSLRALAADLGVSPMPVRDAVRRLVTERALTINPANKRLSVPVLTASRLEQLSKARLWIEPELASLGAVASDAQFIKELWAIDDAINQALTVGDVDRYMAANRDFHFRLYGRANADVLFSLAQSLWLQTGPFMRVVFGRIGAAGLNADRHADALDGLKRGDPQAVRQAIYDDISQGMEAMAAAVAPAD